LNLTTLVITNYRWESSQYQGKLEKGFLSQATLKPLRYKCYIDDLIVLWEHTNNELKPFISNLNSFHPTKNINHEHTTIVLTTLTSKYAKDPTSCLRENWMFQHTLNHT